MRSCSLRPAARWLALGALTAAFAATPAGVAEAKAKPKCSAKGSTTIARTVTVRVYEVGDLDHTVYGCLLSTGKRKALATYQSCGCSISDEPRPRIWLNRATVALNPYGCPPIGIEGECAGSVFSLDLRQRVRKYQDSVPKGYVSQLVLRTNGSFAYIADGGVRKADSAGAAELDAGPVEAGSLARAGGIVYWTKAGQPFSARLQ